MSQFQANLDRLNSNLTNINNEITEFDNKISSLTTALEASGLSQGYIDKMTALKTRLERRKKLLETRKTRLQARITNVTSMQTNEANGFTAGQQTIVDSINTLFSDKYARQMETLKCRPSHEKLDFFAMYAEATSDLLRELIIKAYFNLDN